MVLKTVPLCSTDQCSDLLNSGVHFDKVVKGAQFVYISQHNLMSIYSSGGTWLVTSMFGFSEFFLSLYYFVETCMFLIKHNLIKNVAVRFLTLWILYIDHHVVPFVCLGIVDYAAWYIVRATGPVRNTMHCFIPDNRVSSLLGTEHHTMNDAIGL